MKTRSISSLGMLLSFASTLSGYVSASMLCVMLVAGWSLLGEFLFELNLPMAVLLIVSIAYPATIMVISIQASSADWNNDRKAMVLSHVLSLLVVVALATPCDSIMSFLMFSVGSWTSALLSCAVAIGGLLIACGKLSYDRNIDAANGNG